MQYPVKNATDGFNDDYFDNHDGDNPLTGNLLEGHFSVFVDDKRNLEQIIVFLGSRLLNVEDHPERDGTFVRFLATGEDKGVVNRFLNGLEYKENTHDPRTRPQDQPEGQ